MHAAHLRSTAPHGSDIPFPACDVAYGGRMLRRFISRVYWACSRWTLAGEPAPDRPSVLIGAPHTSNWDFVLMLAIAWRYGIDIRWLGKKSLFRGWRGSIMRRIGGIPVDRDDPSRVVGEVVERIRDGEVFGLVVTPDGTRGANEYWKSGFYRIARETGLPVTLGFVDRTTMTTGLGPTFDLTGDVPADMDRIRAFYADKAGLRPHLRTEPRLRDERRTA
jgi:1-acyl-sn-glycerol-3-phosphate acyltransferase